METVRSQPVPDPRPVGVGFGDDVVDVVQAPRGGLALQPFQDEGAHALAAAAGRDDERDARVAPFGVEPAVPGDLASLDGRGYLRIEGRIKDMIIRGGENIYPREIEDVLFGHPAVAEAVVIGVPDETWGEVVAAYVRPVPGQQQPSPEVLRAYCREHLAPYKTPQHWVFVDAFPMTPSGKIQKYKLREDFAQRAQA